MEPKKHLVILLGLLVLEIVAAAGTIENAERSESDVFADEFKHLRVSERKCLQYKEFYRETFAPRVSNRKAITGKIKCPRNPTVRNPFARRGVFKNEFPHTASLWYEMVNEDRERTGFKFRCSGSLISRRHILVPGHCIYSKWGKPTHVVFGDPNLYDEKTQQSRQVLEISDIVMHPHYVPPSTSDDLAIVILEKFVRYDEKSKNPRPTVRPACLPKVNAEIDPAILLSSYETSDSGALKVERIGSLKAHKECEPDLQEQFGQNFTVRFGDHLKPTMLCSEGMPSKTPVTDMGATLVQQPMRGMPCIDVLMGVLAVENTKAGDGNPQTLVFTKLERYIDWIESVVWPDLYKEIGSLRFEEPETPADSASKGNVTMPTENPPESGETSSSSARKAFKL